MTLSNTALRSLALFAALAVAACGPSDAGYDSPDTEDAEAAADADAMAATGADAAVPSEAAASEAANPRFGAWRLESDAPPPASNVMTYEPWGDGGMKITVASTNADGESSEWSYTTLFDGVFRPVEGQENAETAVEMVDDRTNHIFNRRDGEVYQVIVNVLSEDGNRIDNEYRRTMDDGSERVSHAVYVRIQ